MKKEKEEEEKESPVWNRTRVLELSRCANRPCLGVVSRQAAGVLKSRENVVDIGIEQRR